MKIYKTFNVLIYYNMETPSLTFESWWYEGRDKHKLTFLYDFESQQAQIMLDELLEPQNLEILQNTKGKPLTVWDLHIGCEIDIFGKPTIFKRCDQRTAEWNHSYANLHKDLQGQVEQEVRKYDTSRLSHRLLVQHTSELKGGVWIQGIRNQIIEYIGILWKYRPKLAEKYNKMLDDI